MEARKSEKVNAQEQKERREQMTIPEINWVNERAKCSLAQMFEQLKADVQSDIDARSKLLPQNTGFEFKLISSQQNRFAALKEDAHDTFANRSIVFVLENSAIKVLDGANKGAEIMKATITFNDFGECKFMVNEKERESWQLRRDALEHLFFIA